MWVQGNKRPQVAAGHLQHWEWSLSPSRETNVHHFVCIKKGRATKTVHTLGVHWSHSWPGTLVCRGWFWENWKRQTPVHLHLNFWLLLFTPSPSRTHLTRVKSMAPSRCHLRCGPRSLVHGQPSTHIRFSVGHLTLELPQTLAFQ